MLFRSILSNILDLCLGPFTFIIHFDNNLAVLNIKLLLTPVPQSINPFTLVLNNCPNLCAMNDPIEWPKMNIGYLGCLSLICLKTLDKSFKR